MDYMHSDLRNRFYAPYDTQRTYKKEIRRRCSAAGFAVLLSFAAMNFVATFTLNMLMGWGLYDWNEAAGAWQGVTDQVAYFLMYGVYASLAVLPIYLLTLKLTGMSANEAFPFQKVGGRKMVACLTVGMGCAMFANLATNVLGIRLESIGIPQSSVPSPVPTGAVSAILFFIVFSVIPAIMEELAFRGVVLGLLRKFGDGFAVLISAGLFGLMHGNLVQLPFAFIVGLVLGYLVVRTNSLLPAIIVHFANNFYSCLMQVAEQYVTEQVFLILSYGSMLLLLTAAFFGARYLLKREKDFFAVKPHQEPYSLKSRMASCFSAPGMICVVILLAFYTTLVTVLYS